MDRFVVNSEVFMGQHSIELLRTIKGKQAFIVGDSIMDELGYLQQVVEHLDAAGIKAVVFTGVKPDPDTKVVAEGLRLYMESESDVLVALGGGSAIDTAKGILYSATQMKMTETGSSKKPLFIAIPSTSGTGSEVTNFTVITAEQEKICIVDDLITPDFAILDSICIQHVPQRVVADTGIDVLVHAVESYVSTASTDFSDAFAEKAIRMLFDHLETLYHDLSNDHARDRIQNASCMAGLAFTNTNLGINHSLAHAFGGIFKKSHGRSNAMFICHVMEYNAGIAGKANEAVMAKYAKLSDMLGLPARTPREGAINFIEKVKALKKALDIEQRIKDLGVDQGEYEQALEAMAQTALKDRCTPNSPKQPTVEDLVQLYKSAY